MKLLLQERNVAFKVTLGRDLLGDIFAPYSLRPCAFFLFRAPHRQTNTHIQINRYTYPSHAQTETQTHISSHKHIMVGGERAILTVPNGILEN